MKRQLVIYVCGAVLATVYYGSTVFWLRVHCFAALPVYASQHLLHLFTMLALLYMPALLHLDRYSVADAHSS
jgi:hypothetical protein